MFKQLIVFLLSIMMILPGIQTCNYKIDNLMPADPPTPLGYEFERWFTNPYGLHGPISPDVDLRGFLGNGLTLWPIWKPVGYGVTYFTYNVHNQLIRVESLDMVAEYTYKANGLRLTKTVNGVQTTHVWDGMNIVAELDADGNLINRWIRGFGLLRDMHGVWFIHNGLGDVAALMDSNGNVLRRYRYSAFGVEFDQDPNDTNPWRYRGEYFDVETGMIYLRARFMNPRTGRFITADPHWTIHNMIFGDEPRSIGERECPFGVNTQILAPDILAIIQAGNLYVYCGNNPLMFIDPSGLRKKTVTCIDRVYEFTGGGGGGGGGKAPKRPLFNSNANNPVNPKKVSASYLESRGIEPHQLKREILGSGANIDRFNIFVDRNGEIWLQQNGTSNWILTGEFIIR